MCKNNYFTDTEVKKNSCHLCESSSGDWIILNDVFDTAKNHAELSLLLNNIKELRGKVRELMIDKNQILVYSIQKIILLQVKIYDIIFFK